MPPPSPIRAVELTDAEALTESYIRNRDFLRPFEPARPPEFFTLEGQRARVLDARAAASADRMVRYVILDERAAIAGVITVSDITRGPAQSANVGYWVDRERNGHGLASRALAAVVGEAFDALALHRLDAGVLPDNIASRRVLEKNGFELIGLARRYLQLDGAWRDHLLYQRLAE
jgi:ribosomal-protein-alanine N-acetyltransferase